MSAKKHAKTSKKPSTNQTNFEEPKDKKFKDVMNKYVEDAKGGKIILLNLLDEKQKINYMESINKHLIDPNNELSLKQYRLFRGLEIIECLDSEKGQILDKLDKYIDIDKWITKNHVSLSIVEKLKYSNFYTLFINHLNEEDYDNAIGARLDILKDIKENKKRRYIKIITPNFRDIEKVLKEKHKNYPIIKLLHKVKQKVSLEKYKKHPAIEFIREFKEGYYAGGENILTEDDKCEITEYSNNIKINNIKEIDELIKGMKKKKKDEEYKLIMESTPPLPSIIIINFLNGKAPKEFRQKFKGKLVEIKTKFKCEEDKKGDLRKGKGFKIPKEKFIGTLKETYNWCKKDEKKNGEKWTGTKMAQYAKRHLKTKYGDKYDADFEVSYLENIFSKIKQGKL